MSLNEFEHAWKQRIKGYLMLAFIITALAAAYFFLIKPFIELIEK